MKKLIILFLLATASHFSFAEVTGNAFLEGQTDHSGIKVKFTPNSPTAVLDSTFTIADGSYSIILQPGVYFVTFSKSGYETIQYNDGNPVVITANYILSDVTLQEGGNIVYLSGNVNGTLTSEYIYIVTADITIPDNESLFIEPGTIIKLQSICNIIVHGLLKAMGTLENKIFFTSAQIDPGFFDWGDIHFSQTSSDSSILRYCKIEYGHTIISHSSVLSIENCELTYLIHPISCNNSNVIVKNNYLHNYRGSGVLAQSGSNCTVIDNIFEITVPFAVNPYNGIRYNNGTGIIENNLIINATNQYSQYIDGINLDECYNVTISNNIIYDCGNGIISDYSNQCRIVNNLITNNVISGLNITAAYIGSNWIIQSNTITNNNIGFSMNSITSGLDFSFNDVWNNSINYDSDIPGIGQIIATNNNGDPCDPYFNITLDPMFVDAANQNFHVNPGSPVIDAGINDNVVSLLDLDAYPRIMDGNNDGIAIVDMGVYEFIDSLILISDFTCPDNGCTGVCVTIEYLGTPIIPATYQWDFDGGIIATGYGAGPYQVYWQDTGLKTISLFLSFDNNYSDTTYHNIEILPSPEQSGTPEGPTELCQGTQNVGYSTSGALYAESYQWYATPANAAINISGSTSTVIIDWNQNYYGLAHIYVYGINDCGNGIVSESLEVQLQQEATVTVNVNVSANPICIGDEVTFTATPINGGSSPDYLWQVNGFGVGSNDPVYITSELEDNDQVYCYLTSSEDCVVQGWAISNIIYMFVHSYPDVTIEASPNDTACITETITLNAGNPGCDYFWSTGETTQSIIVSNTSGPSGGTQTYFVEVIKGGICSGYDTISVYFDPCTGIDDLSAASGISIFPNPSHEDLYIQIKEIIKPVSITLFTSQGILIEEFKVMPSESNSRFKVDLAEYPNGIYFLKFQNEEVFEVRKIIKN